MTLSQDLRQRVIQAHQDNEGSLRQLARRFKISPATVHSWIHRAPDADTKPETRGRPPALNTEDLGRLRNLALKHSSATETELAQMMASCDQTPLHRSIIGRALKAMDLTRKKRRGKPASKTDQTSKINEENGSLSKP